MNSKLFLRALLLGSLLAATINAATFVVTKTNNTDDGNCDSDCSLKEAITAANASPTDDQIVFDPLVFSVPQMIQINGNHIVAENQGSLKIIGPGAHLLTLEGSDQARVLFFQIGVIAEVSRLTISNGNGGIFQGSAGTLTIEDCVISGNDAGANEGGGIFSNSGTLIIRNTTIAGNTALRGAGIYAFAGFRLINSRLSRNIATRSGGGLYLFGNNEKVIENSIIDQNETIGDLNGDSGGGIYYDGSGIELEIRSSRIELNDSGSGGGIYAGSALKIINSSLTENQSNEGAGAYVATHGEIHFENSTVSRNTAFGNGGGVWTVNDVYFQNSTVAENDAPDGGGIFTISGGTANVASTIVADNTSAGSADIKGTIVSSGYNLIENTSGGIISGDTTGNIYNMDPHLGPLSNWGGFSLTKPLQSGSPAIDGSNPGAIPETDQRLVPRSLDGDQNGTSLPDIGSFEFGALVVNDPGDNGDGTCDSSCTLRDAVSESNTSATTDVVVFSDIFFQQSEIVLSGTELEITGSEKLTIVGSGKRNLAVSGGQASRIFLVQPNTELEITDLQLKDGNGDSPFSEGSGGALYNRGDTTLVRVVISDNNVSLSSGFGGAIYNFRATLSLRESELRDNSAFHGGAIYNTSFGGDVTIVDSIVRENVAGWGGGLENLGSATVSNSNFDSNTATQSGGGIYSNDAITFTGGSVSLNQADSDGNGSGSGGGVYLNAGVTANFTGVRINNNSSTSGGGGISSIGNLALIDSSVTGNQTGGRGGGIDNDGTLNLERATVSANVASQIGGGIYSAGTGNLINTTISGNTANSSLGGGGIYNGATALHIVSSTIAFNSAPRGGGVRTEGTNLTAQSSIFSDNTATQAGPDFFGQLDSQGHILIRDSAEAVLVGETSTVILGADPGLSPLADNGGSTLTHSIAKFGPAVDAGPEESTLTTDQRGSQRVSDGDFDGIAEMDLGAFEKEVTIFRVRSLEDANDGNCDANCTFREAIAAARLSNGPNRGILFEPSLFKGVRTITLTNGEITFSGGLEVYISGPGADLLSISGNNTSTVFSIAQGAIVTLRGLSVINGNASGILNRGELLLDRISVHNNFGLVGGGIDNRFGKLGLVDSRVANNTANEEGGGIRNLGGEVAVSFSTIEGNHADAGGGIYNYDSGLLAVDHTSLIRNASTSTVATRGGGGIFNNSGGQTGILNSTISGNGSSSNGGGVLNLDGNVAINATTVAFNTAVQNGGGVYSGTGSVESVNSILARNSATNAGPDILGTLTSGGFNLLADTAGATIEGVSTGNILGADPLLLPLRAYGGQTQTHALRPTSPAIDKGFAGGNGTDQRGTPRPFDDPSIPNGGEGGDGSDIGAFERQSQESLGILSPFDFDGDRKTDVSVFRPNSQPTAQWWLLRSSDSGTRGLAFGSSTDVPVAADFTGDGKTDVAFWRPSSGEWFILRSEDDSFFAFPFGANGDIPAPGDFDGDGKADPAVYRPSSGTWFIVRSSDGGLSVVPFGVAADQPIVADYDGDGKDDVGVYRAPDNQFWLLRSTDGVKAFQFGAPGDRTAVGDWTGDGKADVAFFRPSTSEWYVIRSEDDSFFAFPWGATGDIPSPGDFDGDGKFDPAVWRPSDRTWYIFGTTSGFEAVQFGSPGDVPLPSSASVN